MTFRKIEDNGDWTYGQSLANYAEGEEAIVLDVRTALLEWLNDCWFNMSAGVDYSVYLTWTNQEPLIIDSISKIIAGREGVSAVGEVAITIDPQRNAIVNASFTTIFNNILTIVINTANAFSNKIKNQQTSIDDFDFPEFPPNSILNFINGIPIAPLFTDVLTNIQNIDQQIYGTSINIGSNSPDGENEAIRAKIINDQNENILQIYSNLNPTTAVGVALDNCCALTNITRSGATFTYQNIDVIIISPCNLQGLDENTENINGTGFTVTDNIGNNYILLQSQNGLLPGTYTFLFRAQNIGNITSQPNTITNILTTIRGVQSVNNPLPPLVIGTIGEKDAQLRQRQQLSPAQSSNGYLNGLQGKLLAVNGVSFVRIDNNFTNVTNEFGTPPHTIWTIVKGGNPYDIGQVLVRTISCGCGFRGNTTIGITDPQGIVVNVKFEIPTQQIIFTKIILTNIADSSVDASIITPMINYIIENSTFNIGASVYIGDITKIVNNGIAELAPSQLSISFLQISPDGINFGGEVNPLNINHQLSFASYSINITIE